MPYRTKTAIYSVKWHQKRRAGLRAGRAVDSADGGQSAIITAGTEARPTKTMVFAAMLHFKNVKDSPGES